MTTRCMKIYYYDDEKNKKWSKAKNQIKQY